MFGNEEVQRCSRIRASGFVSFSGTSSLHSIYLDFFGLGKEKETTAAPHDDVAKLGRRSSELESIFTLKQGYRIGQGILSAKIRIIPYAF